jgi:cytochrome c553
MSQERLFSARNPWFTASVGITVVVAIFSAFVGFVWLPSVQPDASFQGIWNIICGAAGVPRTWLKSEPLAHSAIVTSSVVVTPQMLGGVDADAIGRGATLALKCTMCHGARGLSEAESPNLAGQPAAMVYKELQYYKSGARMNAVMAPMALGLSDHDMSDLAACRVGGGAH